MQKMMLQERLRPWRLSLEFFPECLFSFGNVALVAFAVDEGVRSTRLYPGELGFHAVIVAVGAKKHIAGQGLWNVERTFIILSNLRILRVAYQLVSGIHIWTAYNHHVV